MKGFFTLILVFASVNLFLSCKIMKPGSNSNEQTDTITIRVGEEKQVFKELILSFITTVTSMYPILPMSLLLQPLEFTFLS